MTVLLPKQDNADERFISSEDSGISPDESPIPSEGILVSPDAQGKAKVYPVSKTREIAQIALCIAILAVCAWVTIPLGAIPITLQMFAITFALVLLPPKAFITAIAGYLLLGAVGLPVFSGMRGGIGVLLGPTGGYLWGYFIGGALGALLMQMLYKALQVPLRNGVPMLKRPEDRKKSLLIAFAGSAVYILTAYALAWAWFMVVSEVGPWASFLATVAPFILLDAAKVVLAAISAQAVLRAINHT